MRLRENATNNIRVRVMCAKSCVWYDRVRYVSLEVPERHIHRCFGSSARELRYGSAAVRGRALLSRNYDRKTRRDDIATITRHVSSILTRWGVERGDVHRVEVPNARCWTISGPLAGNHFVRFRKLVLETPTTAD